MQRAASFYHKGTKKISERVVMEILKEIPKVKNKIVQNLQINKI